MSDGPRAGVAVFAWRDNRFLATLRGAGCGRGMWSVPGGEVEARETWQGAARRELEEETGLTAPGDVRLAGVTSDMCECGESWLTIWASCNAEGTPRVTEETAEWQWVTADSLPAPLWQPFWDNFLTEDTRRCARLFAWPGSSD